VAPAGCPISSYWSEVLMDDNTDEETKQAGAKRPSRLPSPSSSWTWQVVLVVLGLVFASFGFAYLLITREVDPWLATGITLVIVSGVVICVVPSRSGNPFGRRLGRAVHAFLNGGNNQR
jgi:hypothetical protein